MDWNNDSNLDEQGGRGNPRNLGYFNLGRLLKNVYGIGYGICAKKPPDGG